MVFDDIFIETKLYDSMSYKNEETTWSGTVDKHLVYLLAGAQRYRYELIRYLFSPLGGTIDTVVKYFSIFSPHWGDYRYRSKLIRYLFSTLGWTRRYRCEIIRYLFSPLGDYRYRCKLFWYLFSPLGGHSIPFQINSVSFLPNGGANDTVMKYFGIFSPHWGDYRYRCKIFRYLFSPLGGDFPYRFKLIRYLFSPKGGTQRYRYEMIRYLFSPLGGTIDTVVKYFGIFSPYWVGPNDTVM